MYTSTVLLLLLSFHSLQDDRFYNFESSQVRPIQVSRDGLRLYALNTPDARLAVYSLLNPLQPELLQEIPVALEPVSVAERNQDEVWVVGNLSDAVSIVSLSLGAVVATLPCKDEPCDIVFAGNPERAFISIAASKEVRVFDPERRVEVARIPIFAEDPRALASSPNGSTVWVAAYRSGNGTTVVPPGGAAQYGNGGGEKLPEPPDVAKIVAVDDPEWQAKIDISLPDYDVFEIDANSLQIRARYSGVGTILYGLTADPGGEGVWVANTNARNLVRYEPEVRGHVIDSRLTRIVPGEDRELRVVDLNDELEYDELPSKRSLAIALSEPTSLVFDPAGKSMFVAAFGTDRIGVLDTDGRLTGRIEVGVGAAEAVDPQHKRGPRGLAHHPSRGVLYVLNRIANNIGVIDTSKGEVVREVDFVHDPTPTSIRENRGFLYDAKLSGNGSFSCASCHVDGDLDGLAWDLGDPGGEIQTVDDVRPRIESHAIHPLKGPMTTQTLRGLIGQAPYHWRGDKAKLEDFNPAFDGLMGGGQLSDEDMSGFARFMESIAFPPNPNLKMDRTLADESDEFSAQAGYKQFTKVPFAPKTRCVGCHRFPAGSNSLLISGEILDTTQPIKTPHLRNIYRRLGRHPINGQSTSGFGLFHDGTINTVFDLLSKRVFRELADDAEAKTRLERFILSFDTGTAPSVGYARTVSATNRKEAESGEYFELMISEADRGNCDLIAKGVLDGRSVGFFYDASSECFRTDRTDKPSLVLDELLSQIEAPTDVVTFMGVPPGSGIRMGIDRDFDGELDGD